MHNLAGLLQVAGPSRGSYGLNVARLAGVPERVLALAARNSEWMRARRSQSAADEIAEASVDATSTAAEAGRKRLLSSILDDGDREEE